MSPQIHRAEPVVDARTSRGRTLPQMLRDRAREDGARSAISSKRAIRRYDYAYYAIANVGIETAGTIDLDVELKFTIGDKLFSIDVRKDYLEALKDIYKALHTIGKLQRQDEIARNNAMSAASVVGSMLKLNSPSAPAAVIEHYQAMLSALNSAVLEQHLRKDFSGVFEKYIHAFKQIDASHVTHFVNVEHPPLGEEVPVLQRSYAYIRALWDTVE